MKFWLIMFLFTPNENYVSKEVYQTASRKSCVELSETIKRPGYKVNMFCVTDAHYRGTDLDQNMALDIEGYSPAYTKVQP
jgi:citrate lyase alpha subunit